MLAKPSIYFERVLSPAVVVPRQHAHVDHARPARSHDCDAFLDGALECRLLLDRTDSHSALHACHAREIDRRIVDALADPAVLDRAAALLRHAALVAFVVVERAV